MKSISVLTKNLISTVGAICTTGGLHILYAVSVVAQQPGTGNARVFTQLNTSTASFNAVVNTATVVVVGLAFLFFFYNLAKYILAKDQHGEEAKTKMGYALIAIVVITSLWGLVAFVRAVIGIDEGSSNVVKTADVKINASGTGEIDLGDT